MQVDDLDLAVKAGFKLGLSIAKRVQADPPRRGKPESELIDELVMRASEERIGSPEDVYAAKCLVRARMAAEPRDAAYVD